LPLTEPVLAINWAEFARWVVPAACCIMLALASVDSRTSQPYLIGNTNDLLSESGKAQYSAYVSAPAFHSDMNSVPVTRMEWNFGARASAAATGSVLIQFTNSLIR
jgi:hypothetical protein